MGTRVDLARRALQKDATGLGLDEQPRNMDGTRGQVAKRALQQAARGREPEERGFWNDAMRALAMERALQKSGGQSGEHIARVPKSGKGNEMKCARVADENRAYSLVFQKVLTISRGPRTVCPACDSVHP